jgi:hypothetical protein
MTVRMSASELRFRLSQVEADVLLAQGSIREEFCLPGSPLGFAIKSGDRDEVVREGGEISFFVSPASRLRLQTNAKKAEPMVRIQQEIAGKSVCFKIEVDVFTDERRGRNR